MSPFALYSLSACLATIRRFMHREAHMMGPFAQDVTRRRAATIWIMKRACVHRFISPRRSSDVGVRAR